MKTNQDKVTKFWSAIENNDVPWVTKKKNLIKSLRDEFGETALHRACYFNAEDVVVYLVENGFYSMDEVGTVTGSIPLHSAAAGGHVRIVQYLLKNGANPNSQAKNGITPLFSAVARGHLEVVELLLSHGANPMIPLNDGKTCTSIAPSSKILSLLEKKNPIMRIQIFSDLHTEFFSTLEHIPPFNACAPYLALLGDIGIWKNPTYELLLSEQSKKFKKIFLIAGNHEFYGNEYEVVLQKTQEICQKFENVLFLHRRSVVEDGVRIIGATLWTNVEEKNKVLVSKYLSDYQKITLRREDGTQRLITVDDTNIWHQLDLEFIKSEIEIAKKNNQEVVVLTHHAPTFLNASDPKYMGQPTNQGFCTNLDDLMGYPVQVWAFGHTHWSSQQLIKGTQVVSNQLGYVFQANPGNKFSTEFFVEVYR